MTKLKALKEMIGSTYHLTINLNDTFYYACADAEELDCDDALRLLPLYQKYGFDVLKAYFALKRGHDPQVKTALTKDFYKAKEELIKLRDMGDVLFEEKYESNEAFKELRDFDGQTVKWSSFKSTDYSKIFHKKEKKFIQRFNKASLPDGTFVIGGSTYDTLARLRKKYNWLKEKGLLKKRNISPIIQDMMKSEIKDI